MRRRKPQRCRGQRRFGLGGSDRACRLHDITFRAIQVHGALGTSSDMPFLKSLLGASVMGIADGPTEVHKVTVAKQVLRDYQASDGLWPTEYLPTREAAARAKYAEFLEHEVANQ